MTILFLVILLDDWRNVLGRSSSPVGDRRRQRRSLRALRLGN